MGASVEKQLIAELEQALEQQQSAVSQGHAAIRDTIRELHQALKELEQRESTLTKTAKEMTGRAVTQLEALSKSKGPAENHDAALEKIADLERELLVRQALDEKLAASEASCEQLKQQLESQAGQIAEAERTKQKLRKIEQVYKDASDALQAGQAARRRVAELEQTVEEYKQATHAEREKLAGVQQALDASKQSEAALRTELDALKALDIQQTTSKLANTEEALAAANLQITSLGESLAKAKQDATDYEKTALEFEEELAARSVDADQWKLHGDELEKKCTKLKEELEDVRKHARETAENERAHRAAREKLEADLAIYKPGAERADNLQEQVSRLEMEARELRELVRHAEEDLAHERGNGSKTQLAAQLADALRERETARQELRTLRGQPATTPAPAKPEPIVSHQPLPTPASAVDSLDEGFETDGDEEAPLHIPTDDAKRMLGEIFMKAGIINGSQLEDALAVQKKDRPWKHLGSVLVAMGHAEEAQVAQALAHQRGLEYLRLGKNSVDKVAAHRINGRLAEKHICIPVRFEEGELVVAMENPLDLIAIEDVERASNYRVKPAVATPTAILAAIHKIYTASETQRV